MPSPISIEAISATITDYQSSEILRAAGVAVWPESLFLSVVLSRDNLGPPSTPDHESAGGSGVGSPLVSHPFLTRTMRSSKCRAQSFHPIAAPKTLRPRGVPDFIDRK